MGGISVLLPFLFILALNLINILISIWAYRDSRQRGNSKEFSIIVLVALLFFPIIGLIVYLVIRKD
ncbi:PLDc N-terminal domain-containing protein [Brevibacillus choshinensis]|uniref:PLDc N-terminal domain-containing protein n=1 Tax=Brevibacillus choshinensis TaxID=54911 RepID=A0ABX7FXT7_BRECH|nr:PLDc N-terminal domain-containing protein [Brevibacillus choshinensis]QRG70608.1 PLDc N-terminal domain-containing protein [Brevibacillus choshinensis]